MIPQARPFVLALFLALTLVPAAASPTGIEAVGAKDLIERGADFDGRTIYFEGEAIGDPMARGDHAWVNILDSSAALGAWLPADLLPRIVNYGSYRGKGDVLRVRGVFHRACPDHGGDMDIHVEGLEVLSRGGTVAHALDGSILVLAPLALASAALLYFLWRRRERRVRDILTSYVESGRDDSPPRSR